MSKQEPPITIPKTIHVSFLELEQNKNAGEVKDWFPLLEKAVGCSLPKYLKLEGGVYPDKNGVVHCWPGPHYYLCLPTEFVHLLSEYGTFNYSIKNEIDEATLNNQHRISYWGPGCNPKLELKQEEKIHMQAPTMLS